MKTKIAVIAVIALASVFGTVPVSADVGITAYQLSTEEMISPVLFYNQERVTYMTESGQLKQ